MGEETEEKEPELQVQCMHKTVKNLTKHHINAALERYLPEIPYIEADFDSWYDHEGENKHVEMYALITKKDGQWHDLCRMVGATPHIYDHVEKRWKTDPQYIFANRLIAKVVKILRLAYPAATVLQLRSGSEYAPENKSWRVGIATPLKRKKDKK